MAIKGDEAELRSMIEAKLVNIHSVDVSSLKTALHLVTEKGDVACLKVLLDNELDVMAVDKVCVC